MLVIDTPEPVAGCWEPYVTANSVRWRQPSVCWALIIVFTALQGDTFLSAFNFANLINQSAMIIVIAIGLVFVLLLSEIDMSAGCAAGTAVAVLGVTLSQSGWPGHLVLVATLLTGVLIGLLQRIDGLAFPVSGTSEEIAATLKISPPRITCLGVCSSPNARWCEQRWRRRGSIWTGSS